MTSVLPKTIEQNFVKPMISFAEASVHLFSEMGTDFAQLIYNETGRVDIVYKVALGIFKGIPVLIGCMFAPTLTFAACALSVIVANSKWSPFDMIAGKELAEITYAGVSLACASRAAGFALQVLIGGPVMAPAHALSCLGWGIITYVNATEYLQIEESQPR